MISMSLGCDNCFSQATEQFYQDVYDQNVLIIAAAGNSGKSAFVLFYHVNSSVQYDVSVI